MVHRSRCTDGKGPIAFLLAIIGVPALVLGGAQWWALRLVRRSAAPKWIVWPGPVIVALSLAGAVFGGHAAWTAVGASAPAERATILAAAIAEGLNCGAFFCFPLTPVWWVALLVFALRRRGAGQQPPA
jgi:hypothetical protein